MKKITKYALLTLIAVLGITLTSCGGYSDSKAKEMIKKEDKGKLKKEDYAQMLEWYEDIQIEYFDGWEDVIKDNKNYLEYTMEFTKYNANFAAKYPYFRYIDIFLSRADEDDMGKSNYKKYEKLSKKYEERSAKLRKKAPKDKSTKKANGVDDFDY